MCTRAAAAAAATAAAATRTEPQQSTSALHRKKVIDGDAHCASYTHSFYLFSFYFSLVSHRIVNSPCRSQIMFIYNFQQNTARQRADEREGEKTRRSEAANLCY